QVPGLGSGSIGSIFPWESSPRSTITKGGGRCSRSSLDHLEQPRRCCDRFHDAEPQPPRSRWYDHEPALGLEVEPGPQAPTADAFDVPKEQVDPSAWRYRRECGRHLG